MKHIVSFSGGVGSWYAAKRVVERHGTDDVTLLFCDTKMEDEDLYRFLDEAAADVGAQLVKIADGRTPWEIFEAERFLGNSRIDPCSKILKRQLSDKWLSENCKPEETIVYVGIDWTESHRFEGTASRKGLKARKATQGWRYEAPLCEPPFVTKEVMFAALATAGIARPRLYDMGFAHNNCGGFCVKAGQSHFAMLLAKMPERYAWHEEWEQYIRTYLGKPVSILSISENRERKNLTLREFREKIQAGWKCEKFDFGGCGCYIDDPEDM